MSVTLLYGPVAISNCESSFDEQVVVNVTQGTDATVRKQGLYSTKFTVAAGFTTGIIGSEVIPALDLSIGGASASIRMWVRSTVTMIQSDWALLLDNTAKCGSPVITLNMGPVPIAETWYQLTVDGVDLSAATSIISVGIKLNADLGAQTIYIDKIELVSAMLTFNELHITGFDNPENEEGFPQAKVEQLLDGSWYKTTPVATTRNIFLDLGVIQTAASQLFLREFQFAETQQITYDGETISVVSTMNSFPVQRINNTITSKQYTFELKEKTARLIGSAYPTSWTN